VARRRRATLATLVLVLLVGALLSAYSLSGGSGSTTTSSNPSTPTTKPAPPAIRVSSEQQVTFTRSCSGCVTEDYVNGTTTPGRAIVTDIWFPTRDGVDPATTDGSTPLILLASGYDLTPTDYTVLIDGWVRAGYVVAAPVFPVTSTTALAPVFAQYPDPAHDDPHGNPEFDVVNQPGDVAFVLSKLVAEETAPAVGTTGFLHGLFDPSEIGVAGQSDGGDTVAGLFYNSCCQADSTVHVGAVAVLSGSGPVPGEPDAGFFNGKWFTQAGPPLLVVQGTTDACNSPNLAADLYNAAPATPAKYFVTLLGADHLAGYAQTGVFANATIAATLAFFGLYLKGTGSPTSVLSTATTSVSSVTDAATAPALQPVSPTWTYDPGTSLDPCSISFAGAPQSATTTTG
jgi:hypothetical protein